MITIKNVRTIDEQVIDYSIPSAKEEVIEAKEKLLLLPAIVDSHITFGSMDQNNWDLAVQSVVRGGITSVIETPSQNLTGTFKEELQQKEDLIEQRLFQLHIPLYYSQYLSFSSKNLEQVDQIGSVKHSIKGLFIQLDKENKETLENQWNTLFRLAAQEDLPIVIESQSDQSFLEQAIHYTERYSNRLYVLNVATPQEIRLIQEARARSLLVYSETTPHNLFPEDSSKADHLWEAINQDKIETIGSGYKAHTHRSDREFFLLNGTPFHFSDPIFMLPLLLTAYHEKKISLNKLVRLTRSNIHEILAIDHNPDVVLVDLDQEQTIHKLSQGRSIDIKLKGWPMYTILKGHLFSSPTFGHYVIHKNGS